MNASILLKDISKEIADLRKVMIKTGIKKGLTHPDTIKISAKLDKQINTYQKIVRSSGVRKH